MGRRNMSARNQSVSSAAKRHMKARQKARRSPGPEEPPEETGQASKIAWILAILAIIVFALLVASDAF